MKVGVLEVLVSTAPNRLSWEMMGKYLVTKQYASIMPQAVSAWCRQLGHEVFYATYFGQQDPKRLLPDDLDVVFIASYTQASAMAYALGKLFRRDGALTILGGPHAKAFPDDSLRFFDLVVLECDQAVISEILKGDFRPGTKVAAGRPLAELPTAEERMPEIKASVFARGRPSISTVIPMLASVGCPYTCDFCIDWNNPYVLMPESVLEADLRYLAKAAPGVKMGFHDPNFAVKFDKVLDILESIPPNMRNPYVMESSLSILRGPRLQRLKETRCYYIAPGVESWTSYSNKAGVGRTDGVEKAEQVIDHFRMLHEYVPGLQANFIFGLDDDKGDEPVETTKLFMTNTPFVWPVINIPVPFGGTPLYDRYLEQGRILTEMPLAFYYNPYLVTTLTNYTPAIYYEKLVELNAFAATRAMYWSRMRSTSSLAVRALLTIRTLGMAYRVRNLRRILSLLRTDRQFRAFHEGESRELPEFYHQEFERMLGAYAPLLSRDDRRPLLMANTRQAGPHGAHDGGRPDLRPQELPLQREPEQQC